MNPKAILLCAIPVGLAAGYALSALDAPASRAYVPPKATIADVAASPDEFPAAVDREWSTRSADDAAAVASGSSTATAQSVRYSGCNEVRAAGKAPLYSDDPGYSIEMDGDADGIACEPIRH